MTQRAPLRQASALAVLLLLVACGGDEAPTQAEAEAEAAARAATEAAKAEHYATDPSIPPAVYEALEGGRITQAGLDARIEAGEFEPFYVFATPEDLPTDLAWQNGMDLPDLGSPEAVKGGTYRSTIADFPRTLRRAGPDANSSFRPWIQDDTVMGMAQRHPNVTDIVDSEFRYFPGIAEAWAIDREDATIYVRIDPAARFSDGEPITTDDVLFTFFLLQNPHVNAPFAQNYINRNFTRITVYDEHTWSATLPESKPYMASRALSFEPWPEHVFPVVDETFLDRYQWTYVPSSGPYTIREADIRKGRSVTLTRIDDWWAKDRKFWRNRYNFDRITLTVVRDAAKRFEAFRKGEVDATSLTLPEYWYDKLPDSDRLVQGGYVRKAVFYDDKPRPNYALWMNSSRPLLENRDIRVGIQHATNWRKVIDEYFRGDYTRMRTSSDGYGEFTHPTLQPRDFDVDAALEAFARAGFTERGPDGILVNDAGQRLSFTLSTGYDAMRDVLTILREEALAAGLEFRIEVLDSTAAWKKVQERQHDIHFVAFAQAAEMYPRYWENLHSVNAYDRAFLPDGSPNPDRVVKTQTNNLTVTADPEIDALIERYRASGDAAEMIGLAHRLEEMIHEDASYMPAFAIPFYRIAYWRWLRFPDDMDVKITPSFPSPGYLLGWIEPGAREETEAARAAGETFEPVIEVYDQYRPD